MFEESIDFDNDTGGLSSSAVLDSSFLPSSNGQNSSNAESIKVLLRIRPLNAKEVSVNNSEENSTISILSNNSLSIRTFDGRKTYNCSYDTVLRPEASQSQVYDVIKDCTLSVMSGVNATVFAYGQTGSGKTYSMYGPPNYMNSTSNGAVAIRETEMLGVIPRAIHHIFELAKNPKILFFQVHCSFVQIYNENLFDMLR
jgi:hypothetical protein